MKYFGFIALISIFQSIRPSLACNGCNATLTKFESGADNNVKFETLHCLLDDECKTSANAYVTVLRNFTTASISLKIKNDAHRVLYTIKNRDLCKFLSDFNIIGSKCPHTETGRVHLTFGEKANLSEYGPFLPYFLGDYVLLLKIVYDGDEHNPDIFKMFVNNSLKNSSATLV